MRVIWSYKNLLPGGFNDAIINFSQIDKTSFSPTAWTLAKASALSWKLFAPEFERVLYVDPQIYEFLEKINFLENWDKVEVVPDFNLYSNFWANPKSYSQSKQTEPFWVADLDFVLMKPIDLWFDPAKYWVMRGIDRFDKNYIVGEDTERVSEFFKTFCTEFPYLNQLIDFRNMVNGGCVYYADPRIGSLIGMVLQFVQISSEAEVKAWFEQNQKFIPKDTLGMGAIEEEGLISGICNLLNLPLGNLEEIQDQGYIRHFWSKTKFEVGKIQVLLQDWFDFRKELARVMSSVKKVPVKFV